MYSTFGTHKLHRTEKGARKCWPSYGKKILQVMRVYMTFIYMYVKYVLSLQMDLDRYTDKINMMRCDETIVLYFGSVWNTRNPSEFGLTVWQYINT